MHLATVLALGALCIPALAQNFSQTFVYEQSADFNLVVQSPNKTLDGKFLGACHDGAAHEGLCIVDGSFDYTSSYISYQFNTTRYICTETNSTGTFTIPCSDTPTDPTLKTGVLTWWLNFGGSDPMRVSQAMRLEYSPWSNVVRPGITFAQYEGSGEAVAFDKDCLLNIIQYQDDTLEPASEYLNPPKRLYRWYICQTQYSGYRYTTLAWVLGPGLPQNPTCQKVDIKRMFV